MSNLTFKSVEKDGIEFYVSKDGKQTGMSIAGLARCCGIAHSTLRGVLKSVGGGNDRFEKLKPFADKVFIDLGDGESEKNAKIVNSEVCAILITYYAFEVKNPLNDIAKNTLAKFASIGIDSWIKQITGFESETKISNEVKLDQILEILIPQSKKIDSMQRELNEMKPIVKEYKTVKDGIHTNFVGLETLIESIKNEDGEQLLLTSGEKYTLSEWLLSKGITLDRGGICKFGRTVAETFKTCTTEMPKKKNHKKPNGKWTCNCTAYGEEHFPLLEMALNQFIQG